jgi:hypothetical protein
MSRIVTLTEFILQNQADFPYATGELSRILNDIVVASKIVSRDVRQAGLVDHILGAHGEVNVQGEEQQKLDVVADEAFIRAFEQGGEVCGIASEENDDFVAFESESAKNGKYVVLFDPLDGSSNIDVNGCLDTSNCVSLSAVGVEESIKNDVEFFPNPTSSKVKIKMGVANAQLIISDSHGKILLESNIKNDEIINISNYASGVYFFEIKTNQFTYIKKIVKNQ